MNIYFLLASKPHNIHHLNRYIKFISTRIHIKTEYFERHHIAPKSLFPEFTNLKKNSWNNAKISAREHFIAHKILCKVFPQENKLVYALFAMCHQKSSQQERTYKISSREYARLKAEFAQRLSNERKGKKCSDSSIAKMKAVRNEPLNRVNNSYRQLPKEVIAKYPTIDSLITAVEATYVDCWGIPNAISKRLGVSIGAVSSILTFKKLPYENDQTKTKVFLNYNHLFTSYENYIAAILECGEKDLSATQTAEILGINEHGVKMSTCNME